MSCLDFKRLGVASALCAALFTAHLVPARAQSGVQERACLAFEDVINAAIARSARIDIAQADLDQRQAERKAASATRLPQLSLRGRAGFGDGLQADNQLDNRVGLVVSQLLFDFGATRARVSAARARTDEARFSILDTQTIIGFQAAQTYLDSLKAEENLAVTTEIEAYYAQDAAMVERRLQRQLMKQSEASGIRAEYALAKARKARIKLQIRRAQASLSSLLNRPFSCGRTATVSEYFSALQPTDLEGATQKALTTSASINAAQAQIRANQADARNAQRSALPSVSLNGSFTYDYDTVTDRWNQFERFGLDVQVPLFQGGQATAQNRAAKARLRRARAQLEEERRVLEEQIALSWAQSVYLEDVAAMQRDARNSFGAVADAVQREYDRGIATIPQLIDAKRDYFNAALSEIETRYEVQSYKLELLANIGSLQQPARLNGLK